MEQSEDLVISTMKNRSHYNRTSHPQIQKLGELLMKNYNVKFCHVTSSGMNAISTLFHSIFIHHKFANFNIIYGNELYCDTPRLFEYFKEVYGMNIDEFMITSDNLVELFETDYKAQNNILYIESCSNPSGYIFDFSMIDKLRSLSNILYVIVDNTWLTEVIFNPFEHGCDFTVTSLTKYYGGGVAIGGAILSNNEPIMTSVMKWSKVNGQHVSPYNCELIYNNILTMKDRIANSSSLTTKVIEYLKSKPKISNMSHPLLANHVSYNLAIKYFKTINDVNLGPSVLTFMVKTKKNNIIKFFKNNTILDFKTSFGSQLSRIDSYPGTYYNNDHPEIKYTVLRLALGYNDTYERVVEGLDELFMQIE
ncbi:cystathionine beta-lyase/cystathionine gamma-synthase [Klosneuvirus KNV1]|uniref:Cystathionine beta-lyase/cystathionine gamma-synthase n=1 Tax=Klosneuvirus KNV1 TaxID=1977640 RepID=A0A1V0SL56_9VIRU|nr:cystathionine beta-lyase/cystathionine gamma-synthase [Klosneuvirus KNV1]